jgi:hypothetical protein
LHPPPAPLEDVVDDGLMAIQRAIFLKKAGVDTTVDEDFLLNPPTRADLLELAIKNMSRCLRLCFERFTCYSFCILSLACNFQFLLPPIVTTDILRFLVKKN